MSTENPSPAPAEKQLIHTPEQVEDALKSRVFSIVAGATFPTQADYCGPIIPLRNEEPDGQRFWVKHLPQLGKISWPWRMPHFAVVHSLEVGTLEELVELYRSQLYAAARRVVGEAVSPHVDTAKSLENAQVHGYVPGKAINVPFYQLGDKVTLPFLRKAVERSEVFDANQAAKKEGEITGPIKLETMRKYEELLSAVDPAQPISVIHRDVEVPGFLIRATDKDELERIARLMPYDVDGTRIYFQLIPPPQDRIDLFNGPAQSVMADGLIEKG